MHILVDNAIIYIKDSLAANLDTVIDRIDVRPDKGVVKISFKDHYIGLQIDGATGKVLKKKPEWQIL